LIEAARAEYQKLGQTWNGLHAPPATVEPREQRGKQ
jgi:hypothetical protein